MTARPHVEIRDAVIGYTAGGVWFQATAPLTLDIAAGECLTMVGPSGCGKTSLLNALAGLVRLARGEIRVDGSPVRGPAIDRAVVFQDYALLPWRTVRDNVAFGLTLAARRATAHDLDRRVDAALALVGLTGFARSYPHQLSGGMKQRVGIARALVVEPALLLMDEPFAAVDAITRELMQDELLKILQARRMTVVFVTHSIDEAIALGDRIAVMTPRPGRIREVIAVPFPRPRVAAVLRVTPAYHELREHIWDGLRAEGVAPAPAAP